MRKETKAALRRLQELANDGDRNIFERITLAAGVVKDDAYLAEFHNGDQDKAMEVLEASYFVALAGYVRLHVLLAIHAAFPDESKWVEYRYDLRAMELLWREQKAKDADTESKKPQKRATAAEVQELKDKADELSYQLKREREASTAKDVDIERLRQRIRELEEQVAEFRGRLSAFEQMRAVA